MDLGSIFLAELVGTAVLILLGCGVVANVVLKGTKGNGGGWLLINFGWGFAVFIGVLSAAASGGHLNPAVTLGLAANNLVNGEPIDGGEIGLRILAQLIGGVVPAAQDDVADDGLPGGVVAGADDRGLGDGPGRDVSIDLLARRARGGRQLARQPRQYVVARIARVGAHAQLLDLPAHDRQR